ncbi:hypothetical protein BJY21_000899 [Kineosphaera limosa]|uniref:DUF998 domain-containing protein n=1 Tax=Kineosphaera limosa NBRC 100340 TaxID=1184609 RepID=K6VQ36_9MICO|nr:DUF998 domain-containing protein [Kineosphaera limosa]NYD99714.1 hypothetical protein [Kineosphaera limosa]GAB98288.1 hypothetical protein KILIM_122_00050 [Kineosphaera limosa NBRC 100340]
MDAQHTRRWSRVAAGIAAFAALLYSAWLMGPWLNPEHDTTASYVSELAASDQPFSRVFRGFDAAAGLMLALAVGVLLVRDSGSWLARLRRNGPYVALGLFGLATVADSLLPLSCAATADPICAAEEKLGLTPWTHQLHTVSSSLAGALAVVALVWAAARVWRRRREGAAPSWLVAPAIGLALVHTVALGYTLLEIAGLGVGGLGWAQRVSLAALALWWVLLFLSWRRGLPVRSD